MGRQIHGVGLRRSELERRKPLLDPRQCLLDDLLRREVAEVVARDPDVRADAVSNRAAEQLVNGDPVELAEDVPERDIDSSQRARENRAAAQEARAPHDLPVRLDSSRVLADQVAAQVVHRGLDSSRSELHAGLSPAGDPFIGADRGQTSTAGGHDERVDGSDLHAGSLAGRGQSMRSGMNRARAAGLRRRAQLSAG